MVQFKEIRTAMVHQGVLDDGALRAEARQHGAITMSFQYNDKGDTMFKSATHTWRLAELYFDEEEYVIGDTAKLTMSDLDGLRYPFDKKLQYPLRVILILTREELL